MLKFVLISALVAGASAGYSSSQFAGAGTSSGLYNQVNNGQNAYADKYPYTNTGYNGGFTSNYAGQNGVGAAAGTGAFVPGFASFQSVPAFPNVFDYNSFYQGLQANFANAAATQAFATAGATAAASASNYGQYNHNHVYSHQAQYQPQQYQQVPQRSPGYSTGAYSNFNNNHHDNGYNNFYNPHNLYQQQFSHQNALFNSIRQQQAAFAGAGAGAGAGVGSGVGAGFGTGGNYGGPGFAGASAAYGPGGFHQTAHVYPENPQSPNINTRFGGGSQQGAPGFVGVSSFSSSSNINGQSHREAATSVNDNGKVTSYHVRS